MSNNNTDDTVARLHAKISKATRQAHSALISSNETILGIDNFVDGSCEGDDDNNNTRKGQEVGIALFGTDQKYKDQLQDQFQNKLCVIEEELAEIQQGLQQQDNLRGDEMGSSDVNNNNISMTSSSIEEGNFSSINNVAQLQSHVVFLQLHNLLEDVDTLSLQTNFATSSIISGSGNSGASKTRNGGNVAFPFSPSSICSSPSEFNKFTFDSPGESSTGSNGEKISPMVKAAQLVNQAEGILNKVMNDLNEMCNAENNGVDKENNNEPGNTKSSHILQMQTKMLTELQHQTRRKKMELRHRAITLVEGCVVVEKDALIVRGSNTCEMKSTNNNNKKKTVAFDVVESPISTSTPTNNDDSSPSPPPSPLSDAYQVLHLFSDDNFPNFGESLDGAMKQLSTKLLNVIQSCLVGVEAQSSDKKKKGDDKGVRYYKLTEESLRKGSGGSGSGSNRRYDPVTIKGPAVQLQWCLVPLVDGESHESDITKLESVVTSNEINEETLQSLATVSPSMTTFIGILNFLTRFLNFVHQHVLVGRSDLAQMLGKHLFGIYPLPNTSIASGSVMLSGVLLGAAAQGIEDGEEMPLMTDMVTAMKKYCIPKESSPEVWKMLHSMKECLVKEISSFETKLVELDMMIDTTTTKSAKTSSSTTAITSSSPTGLSVLLNNDGVGSPINPNATLSNLSNLDTTFPEAAQHAASTKAVAVDHRDNMKILSPLSELVNSLGQAYVEGQRVYILNQGRSILLNTDYHNTCQQGTFVPEINEPGSLSSLDDEPLKILFAFHQCAISTTAQSIMELCRKTMDDATDHELASSEFVEDSLPPMLYRASRELMDLFRAIIPTRHASEIASIPRMAAVLHNDCVYFAHEAALLGAEYKAKFHNLYSDKDTDSESKSNTRLLGEVCSFMDMVPPFRDLATKSMGAMLEAQKGQLYELVSPRLLSFEQALGSNESVTEWDDADTALRAALYHLGHLCQAWKPILSRCVYHMTMGNLVDLVLTLYLDSVIKAEDITESASRFVHSLLLDATKGTAEMFIDESPDNNNHINIDSDDIQQQRSQLANKYSSLFGKAQAVGKFMSMRLDEIERGLEEGVFKSVTAKELSHLIHAAFDDSAKRTSLLNSLVSN